MSALRIPVGISDYTEMRTSGCYYIDKSGLIGDILDAEGTKVTLITRPRRFGKTLGMSMLECYLDIRKDSRALFEGLEIAARQDLRDAWMNQWPVASISFKCVDGLTFDGAYQQLAYEIGALYREHEYLLHSEMLREEDKVIYRQIRDRQASRTDVMRSLELLTRMMRQYYGKSVVLLIDEYDVPLAKASSHGYYDEMLEVMRGMMQALKDNPALQFAVITGCLRIAKESIFTGTNNFVVDTITDSRLNEYFGFTQREVDRILADADAADHAESVKEWYDGYHFGDADVYCPWDVMNYLTDLQRSRDARPVSYWRNTSDNAIIRSFIDYAGASITNKLETLMAGGYIVQRVDENLTYDVLHSSEDNLWSLLYLTGYLTMARVEEIQASPRDGMLALMIPNAEIREIYETTIVKWFDDSARRMDRSALFGAVWNGDCDVLSREMNALLRRTISYHDYREDYYHAFLAGIFTGAGYMVESNKEHGEGRSDVVVYDSVNGRVAIFEAKYTRNMEDLERACDAALDQIDTRMYAEEYRDDYDEILCYGIAFFKKRCLVRRK